MALPVIKAFKAKRMVRKGAKRAFRPIATKSLRRSK